MTGLDVLHRELSLPHEWQLGAGRGVVWAPSAPTMLQLPGFRDPGSYFGENIDPVFAITLLDSEGRSIQARASQRNWNPARLELKYRLPEALITERRTVLSLDAFVSHLTVTHASDVVRRFWIVMWTRRPDGIDGHELSEIEANPQGISFQESILDSDGRERNRYGCALGASFDADSWSVNGAQSPGAVLTWESTPFYDLMAPGGLPGHLPAPDSESGYTYFSLAYPFEIPPGEKLVLTLAAAVAQEVEVARNRLERCVSMIDPIQVAEEEWINWFEEVPSLSCSDPFLQRVYWYRWAQRRIWDSSETDSGETDSAIELEDSGTEQEAGVRRLEAGVQSSESRAHRPAGEILGAVLESSWQHSSKNVHDQLSELLSREDEVLTDFPVAHAIRRVLSLHPDRKLLKSLSCRCKHLSGILSESAANSSAANSTRPELAKGKLPEPWGRESNGFLRPSLSRNIFEYDLLRLMEWFEEFGLTDSTIDGESDEDGRAEVARSLAESIREEFWDEEHGFFVERLPNGQSSSTGFKSAALVDQTRRAKTVAGFYPLLAGLADPIQRARLLEHLYDPEEFWTHCPVPTLSRDDSEFSADGHWQNQRLDRPMHGRTWLQATSLVLDALGREIERASVADRLMFGELLHRFAMLAFEEGDIDRPAIHEHYNPLTGRPAQFLGRSGSEGSWLIDHLLRYVAGIRPLQDGQLVIDPLPLRLEWFAVSGLFVGNHELEVEWDHRTGLSIRIDDEPAGHASVGQSLLVSLPDHWDSE